MAATVQWAPASPAPVENRSADGRLDGRWLAAVVLVLGLGLGALTEVAQGVLTDPWAAWANSVAAWCLPAFAVGALAREHARAMAAGVAVLLLLLAGYYGVHLAEGVPVSVSSVVVWTGAALIAGVVFGLAGAWWRSPSGRLQVLGGTLISAVLVAEGGLRAVMFPWQGSAGLIMAAVGGLLALALARGARQRVLIPVLVVAVLPLAGVGYELTDRIIAWY